MNDFKLFGLSVAQIAEMRCFWLQNHTHFPDRVEADYLYEFEEKQQSKINNLQTQNKIYKEALEKALCDLVKGRCDSYVIREVETALKQAEEI